MTPQRIGAVVQHTPLCVDLDGTLIKSDTLFESVVLLARRAPWMLLLLPFWLLRGRSYFKQRISELVQIDPALLPYMPNFWSMSERDMRGPARRSGDRRR